MLEKTKKYVLRNDNQARYNKKQIGGNTLLHLAVLGGLFGGLYYILNGVKEDLKPGNKE